MKIKVFGIIFLSLTFLFTIGQNKPDLHSMIPQSGEIANWTVKDSARVYSDEDLYMYIDGGADLYLEYGFKQVISCKYQNPRAIKIHIEIYEMDSSEDAFGVYTINSSGIGKKLDIGTGGIIYDYYLHFWKSKYYIRCTSTMRDQGVVDTLKLFANFIADRIAEPGKKPHLIQALDFPDHEVSGIKYFKGQVGLGNVFNFSHGSVTGFIDGISGKFDDKQIFVFSYNDERSRREWFASCKGKMNMSQIFSDLNIIEDGFTVKDRVGTLLSFKPFGKYYCAIKGMDWKEAQPVFEKVKANLE